MDQGMLRREFVQLMGGGACLSLIPGLIAQALIETTKADATLRISPIDLEIAPGKIIKTIGYNGSAPGPFLRFRKGQQVTIDVFNDTKDPELVHWHGLFLPAEVDGAEEEGTPLIPPKSSRRYSFIARPSGTRWYHTHVHAGRNLKRSTYAGQLVAGTQKLAGHLCFVSGCRKHGENRSDGNVRVNMGRTVEWIDSHKKWSARLQTQRASQFFGKHGRHRCPPQSIDKNVIGRNVQLLLNIPVGVDSLRSSVRCAGNVPERHDFSSLNRSRRYFPQQSRQSPRLIAVARLAIEEFFE